MALDILFTMLLVLLTAPEVTLAYQEFVKVAQQPVPHALLIASVIHAFPAISWHLIIVVFHSVLLAIMLTLSVLLAKSVIRAVLLVQLLRVAPLVH